MLSVKYQPLDSDLGYINHVRVDLSALARQFATNPVVNTRLIASRNNTYRSIEQNEKREEQVVIRGRKLGLVDSEQIERGKLRPVTARARREKHFDKSTNANVDYPLLRVVRSLIRARA